MSPLNGLSLEKNYLLAVVSLFSVVHESIEKIKKGSLNSIPSPSVKIQIMGGKLSLRCISKTLLGDVNKLFVLKSLLTTPNNVLPYYLK